MRNVDRTENPELAEVADEFNREMNNISTKSFGGQTIIDIELPVGVEVEIPHSLKVTPKYRIILRQSDNLTITDGDTAWDEKKIYLKAVAPDVSGGTATIVWPTTVPPNQSGIPMSIGGTVVAPLRQCNSSGQTNISLWNITPQWTPVVPYFLSGAQGVVLPSNVNINFSGTTSVDTVIVSILLLKE